MLCIGACADDGGSATQLPVFTDHPELLCGVSFIAVRSDHSLAALPHSAQPNGVPASNKNNIPTRLLNTRFINPLTDKTIPIVVSDDVRYDSNNTEFYLGYGSGCEQDASICRQHKLDVVGVLQDETSIVEYMKRTRVQEPKEGSGDTFNGIDTISKPTAALCHSGPLDGLTGLEARAVALQHLEQAGARPFPASSRQKDWLISRQVRRIERSE